METQNALHMEFIQKFRETDLVTCSYPLDLSNMVVSEKAINRISYVGRVVK